MFLNTIFVKLWNDFEITKKAINYIKKNRTIRINYYNLECLNYK